MGEWRTAATYFDALRSVLVASGVQEQQDGGGEEEADVTVTEETWDEDRESELRSQLQRQRGYVAAGWRREYESNASKYWHRFYRRHRTNFFKDRHYLDKTFPELADDTDFRADAERNVYRGDSDDGPPQWLAGSAEAAEAPVLVDIGCGVGNTVFPLLEVNSRLRAVALDFAKSAIEELKEHGAYPGLSESGRLHAEVFDAAKDPIPAVVSQIGGADVCIVLFCLSAVPAESHATVIEKAAKCLRRGGRLLFRDYGRFDMAQMRFRGKQNRLAENFYVRSDGTCSYFFTLEEIDALCTAAGLRKMELSNIARKFVNRETGVERRRRWVHAKYEKPMDAPTAIDVA